MKINHRNGKEIEVFCFINMYNNKHKWLKCTSIKWRQQTRWRTNSLFDGERESKSEKEIKREEKQERERERKSERDREKGEGNFQNRWDYPIMMWMNVLEKFEQRVQFPFSSFCVLFLFHSCVMNEFSNNFDQTK